MKNDITDWSTATCPHCEKPIKDCTCNDETAADEYLDYVISQY